MKVSFCARTDVGRTRPHNEDRFILANLGSGEAASDNVHSQWQMTDKGVVLAVLDGMGGAAAGEVASRMAAESLHEEMTDLPEGRLPQEYAVSLDRAIQAANKRIYELAQEDSSKAGMGTTISAAAVYDTHLFLAQVGDSRAYLIRDWKITQVTKDQSLVEHLLSQGQITPEQAKTFQGKNVILQALGPVQEVLVDLKFVPMCQGDILVLCTDGLHGQMDENEILALVARHESLEEAAGALIKLANDRGGPDNITVAIARFDGEFMPAPEQGGQPKPMPVKYVRLLGRKETAQLEADLGVGYWLTKRLRSPVALVLYVLLLLGAIGYFGWNFRTAAEQVKRQRVVDSTPTRSIGTVVVTTDVADAKLFIGGALQGKLDGKGKTVILPEGSYVFQLRAGAWSSRQHRVRVRAPGPVEVRILRKKGGSG